MSLENPVIAVIGTGAIGSFYGATLARRGFDVHFLARSDLAVLRERGLVIKSIHGDFAIPPQQLHAYDNARQMPKADVVLITVKTTANEHYKSLIGPLLKEDTAIVCMQNGLGNEERLGELFGANRILGAMAFVGCLREAPGVVRHQAYGQIRLGEHVAGHTDRTERIARIFRDSGIACEILADLRVARWEKLVWNIPFNGLGAAMDLTTDELLATAAGEALVREIMSEVAAAAGAAGAAVADDIIDRHIRITRPIGAYRTSMQVDRELGRPMEIEAIIGYPLRIAQQHRVAVPRWESLHAMLTAL
jgi:2-dehydropantoate 2-reductase